jgi:hypothetical protein
MKLKYWISTSALGIASASALSCRACLQDIAHGEADVRNEWWVVRISFLLMASSSRPPYRHWAVRRAVGQGLLGAIQP